MTSRAQASARRWTGRALALLSLAVAAGEPRPALATGEARPAAAGVVQQQRVRHPAHGLEARVQMITRALGLDARQQAQLRKLLQDQRERILAAWSDPSVAPARRVAATQAIGDETTTRFRALLDDAQRRKLGPPRQARAPAGPGSSVEYWMAKGGQR